VRYEFIDRHREEFTVNVLCHTLNVSRSGYYAWRDRPLSERDWVNQSIVTEMRAIHRESRQTYGSPRVYAELRFRGYPINRKRVERLMRLHGMAAKQRKKHRVVTTNADPNHPVAPNLLNQDFTASRPNEKWAADISYIETAEGWLYLASIMDLFSRRIVGWAMADNLETDLPKSALAMALQRRCPPKGLIQHSDRGSQYTSAAYQAVLAEAEIQVSMSGTGNCYDNAAKESFFGTLKMEHVYWCEYKTRAEGRASIFEYIEVFYNRRRRHSTIGYHTPEEFERLYVATMS